jgi:hypothetical protein
MVPTSDEDAFMRLDVFAEKIATGRKVRLLGPNYVTRKKPICGIQEHQRTIIMMGRYEQTPDIPLETRVSLVGVDQYLLLIRNG